MFKFGSEQQHEEPSHGRNIVVPERLQTSILATLAGACRRFVDPDYRAPILLIISGPPGTGKTTMARHAIEQIGFKVSECTPGSIAGAYEGDPVKAFCEQIEDICAGPENRGYPIHTMILNDFDLSTAGKREEAGTVNSNLINSTIMQLCDDPHHLQVPLWRNPETGESVQPRTEKIRVPFLVMTANDTTRIHPPLRRHGRARIIRWAPTPAELAQMIEPIFAPYQPEERAALVSAFPTQSIAFFEALAINLANLVIEKRIRDSGQDLAAAFSIKNVSRLAVNPHDVMKSTPMTHVIKIGQSVEKEQFAMNDLQVGGA